MSRPSEGSYLRTVFDAATRLFSQLDRDDLLTRVVREVVGIFGCREAGIYLTERCSSSLVLATRDSVDRQGEALGQRCRMGEGAVGIAAQTCETYVYGGSVQENRGWEVALPIKIGEELIGVLDVLSWPGQLFDENIRLPLELLSILSALAIHARRLIRLNREGQDRLKAILNATESAILLVDPEGVVRVANGKAGELFGMDPAVINGMSVAEILRENAGWRIKDLDTFQDWLSVADAISGLSLEGKGMPGRCDLEMSHHGKTAYFSAYLSPVTDVFGKRLGKILVISDVTDLRKAQRVLAAVSQTAAEINRNLEIRAILNHLMKAVKPYVPVDAMVILEVDGQGKLTVLGARPEKLERDASVDGRTYEGKIEGDFLVDLISELGSSVFQTQEGEGFSSRVFPREFLTALYSHEMRSMIAVPLYLSGRMIGVWVLAAVQPRAYSYGDLAFLEPMTGHLAAAINNAMLLARTREMYRSSVRALAAAVDARDSYTMHHSEHVARLGRAMAEEMGLGPEEVEIVEMAGLVHDLGKVGIPDAILNKPGPLDPVERSIMMGHAHIGASILARAGMMEELVPLVRHHHEWYDGSGYPDGLKGSEVPIGAWILAVADAFDTIISDRAYRPRRGLEEAREELRRMAGTQFHPEVVEVLDRVIEKALEEDASWFKGIVQEGTESAMSFREGQATLAEEAIEPINAREVRVLLRIVDEMMKLLDIRELMNHVVNIIHEEMGYRNCAVLLPDNTWSNLVVVASRGLPGGVVGLRLPKGTGISWWVMEHGLPQNISDVTKDPRFYGDFLQVRSELYVPLLVAGKCHGVLLLQDDKPCAFDARDMKLMMAIAGHIAQALEVAELHDEVKKSAQMDPLTCVLNRRHFMAVFEGAVRDAALGAGPSTLSVVILDVDGLRDINNTYGHLTGDEVLIAVAASLREGTRACDVVGRYGGDEFVLLFPGASREAVEKRVREMVQEWTEKTIRSADGREVPLPSATFAVALYPEDGDSAYSVLSAADERLLEKKYGSPNARPRGAV